MDKKSLSHTTWKCQYHIVFIPKYRKKKLYGQVRTDVREIIQTLCGYKGVEIVSGAVCIDHVHLCIREYFFWITLGIPFYMFGQAMNPVIRADGSPKFAMASTLAGAAINIVLDPIFIFVFRWGTLTILFRNAIIKVPKEKEG